ncbi:unnamed protein product [Penicillium salamii]|uniref:Uncharacterized protein n=1 Tax=Penicillium salamii TaxID=1612424 RepID=A0A9W4ITF7_9EURO|nr:unnamed protein product [Penicillium salamii]
MNSVRRFWASIPKKSRRKIGRHSQKSFKISRKSDEPINTLQINSPPDFLASVDRWQDNPLSFFTESRIDLDLSESPLAQLYIYLKNLEQRTEKDIVRSRLIKVLYYRLKNRLCLNYVRANELEILAEIISKTGMVNSDLKGAKKNFSKWVTEGKRLDTLCKDVDETKSLENTHLGVLFCLPEDADDEFIRAIPLDREPRSEAIKHLRDRGILRVEGKQKIDALASKIFDCLWEKVERSIQDLASKLDSNWAMQRTQAFQIQTEREPENDELNTPNSAYSPTPDPCSSASGSTAVNIQSPLRSTLLEESIQLRDRDPDIPGPQAEANSIQPSKNWYHQPFLCARENQSFQIRDTRAPQPQNSRPATQPTQTSQYESYTRALTTPQYHLNIPDTGSSVIDSAVTTSVESLSASMRLEAESRRNLNGDTNQESQPIRGPHHFPCQVDQAMAGTGASYNLFEDGQLMEGPHYPPDDQAMAGTGASYNLFEDGQLMGGPHYPPFQDDQAMAGTGASYNLFEDGQPMGGPHYPPFQDDQAMTGIESAMTPISTTVQGPGMQPATAITPCIPALFNEGRNFVESSFSSPILSI